MDSRKAREKKDGLIARLEGLDVPAPPEGFWAGLRTGVRQELRDARKASGEGTGGRFRYALDSLPLWQRVLVPAAAAIALLMALPLTHRDTPPELHQDIALEATILEKLVESDVEPYIEVDVNENEVVSMLISDSGISDGMFYELYGLGDEELGRFYESLGEMTESM